MKYLTLIGLLIALASCAHENRSDYNPNNGSEIEKLDGTERINKIDIDESGLIIKGYDGYYARYYQKDDNDDKIYAIMEWAIESPGDDWVMLGSKNGGEDWDLIKVINKKHYLDEVEKFKMYDDGSGYILCSQDLGMITGDDDGKGPLGHSLYILNTIDSGKTWNVTDLKNMNDK